MNEFIEQPEFQAILKRAADLRSKPFSDVVDAEGNQYVDLVQEGGGVLGIALVGYTYVLEEAGIRFFSLAGTSAGAINTLVMAGSGKIGARNSEYILEKLANKKLFDFVDGNKNLKEIVQSAIEGKPMGNILWSLLFRIGAIKRSLIKKLGLNPGDELKTWISEVIAESQTGIKTIGELLSLRQKDQFPEGLQLKSGEPYLAEEAKIHIITAEVTTQTKVRFPEMAHLYWGNRFKEVAPSEMVRASMSVPFFFEPFQIDNIPDAGQEHHIEWDKYANYNGPVPSSAKFVDGGLISNFPINVFHNESGKPPAKPTFGARLSTYRDEYANITSLGSLAGAIISTMRFDSDDNFLIKHPEFDKLITLIDASAEFKWLNFNMSRDRQKELFLLGAKKAIEFLEKFDWEGYKVLRKAMDGIKQV